MAEKYNKTGKKNGEVSKKPSQLKSEVRSYFPKTHLDSLMKGVIYMDDIYAKPKMESKSPMRPTRLDAIHR